MKIFTLILFVLFCAKTTEIQKEFIPKDIQIKRIDTGVSYIYLILAKKNILIDTSAPTKKELIQKELEELGIKPEIVILTHGHGDHAGNAKFFQTKYNSIIIAGKADQDKFSTGKNGERGQSIGLLAKLLKPFVTYDYEIFTPDISLEKEYSLKEYGVPGNVIPLAGHTPDSLVILLENGVAFVGDLIRGGVIMNQTATEHFFHEDRNLAKEQLKFLLSKQIKMFYPAHFGPLNKNTVEEYLKENQ